MTTITALFVMLLGFVPFIIGVAAIVTAFWAATKLFPKFGATMAATYDAMMGTDVEYDKKHNTGYTYPARWK